jgi:hypothetical protein
MVPDLKGPKMKFGPDQWLELISNGKPNTLMPAFHSRHGGPLTGKKIQSLVDFLNDDGFGLKQ